ncbi:hypothetical protein UPYG_G00313180 [Umbra pygmaea]|uniref:Uncharacterized protein n=1 Tax=Umbra pygmaea TaxID=75934 RepID=A0ABD0WHP3_UMBPY
MKGLTQETLQYFGAFLATCCFEKEGGTFRSPAPGNPGWNHQRASGFLNPKQKQTLVLHSPTFCEGRPTGE